MLGLTGWKGADERYILATLSSQHWMQKGVLSSKSHYHKLVYRLCWTNSQTIQNSWQDGMVDSLHIAFVVGGTTPLHVCQGEVVFEGSEMVGRVV